MPGCGVLSGLIKDRPTSRVKDLPHGPVPLVVWVRKRRFACAEVHDDEPGGERGREGPRHRLAGLPKIMSTRRAERCADLRKHARGRWGSCYYGERRV